MSISVCNSFITVRNGLRLRLTLDTAANIASSGATVGNPTISGQFILTCSYTEGVQDIGFDVPYQSYDFEDIELTSIPSGTATDIICDGFSGTISFLSVMNELQTDIGTNHNYLKSVAINSINLQIGADKQYYQTSDSSMGIYLQSMFKDTGDYSTLTVMPSLIPLGIEWNPRAFTGGLAMRDIKFLRVNVTQTAGSSYGSVVSVRSVQYKIEGGHLKRYLFG